MFTISSTKKLPPARPKNIYSTVLVKPKEAPQEATVWKKNNTHPKRKTPVLTTGQTTAAAITAKY